MTEPPTFVKFIMPECRTIPHPVSLVPEWKTIPMPESVVPDWDDGMPKGWCWRHRPRCRCPAMRMTISVYLAGNRNRYRYRPQPFYSSITTLPVLIPLVLIMWLIHSIPALSTRSLIRYRVYIFFHLYPVKLCRTSLYVSLKYNDKLKIKNFSVVHL